MPTIDEYKLGSFCWYELATTDQAAAKNFYTSLFGWTINDLPMGPEDSYSMFQLEGKDTGAAYTLRPDQRSHGVPPHWMLYIAVQSADEMAQRAGELSGKILAPAFDVQDIGRMAVLADPTGAAFSIWQPKKHSVSLATGLDGSVCWADLSTSNTENASDFYSRLFGWNISSENDPSGYLHIKNGEDFIGGIQASAHRNPQVPPHWLIYFLVSDCEGAGAKATGLGAQFLLPPTDMEKVGRMAVLKDPQGAVFALFSASGEIGRFGEAAVAGK